METQDKKETCKWYGNLDSCGNETCWDLGVCQGNPPAEKTEIESLKEQLSRLGNEYESQVIEIKELKEALREVLEIGMVGGIFYDPASYNRYKKLLE